MRGVHSVAYSSGPKLTDNRRRESCSRMFFQSCHNDPNEGPKAWKVKPNFNNKAVPLDCLAAPPRSYCVGVIAAAAYV